MIYDDSIDFISLFHDFFRILHCKIILLFYQSENIHKKQHILAMLMMKYRENLYFLKNIVTKRYLELNVNKCIKRNHYFLTTGIP